MKAVIGAAMIAGAVALDIVTGGAATTLTPLELAALGAVAGTGVSMVAGSIAQALAQNRGMGLTIRQPAANRNYIYGTQRIGGVSIFESTTGSGPAQRNYVIVLADHQCHAIPNLYLDGRQVFWKGSGPGWNVRNGVGFGGDADHNDHTDEGGNHYNFGGLVYCEARYGDQLPGDVMASLTANDGRWKATTGGSPYVGGCTYIYLKLEADASMFPSDPEIRVTVQGKNDIWDPRTNTKGYSENWSLCVADALMNAEYGIGEQKIGINTAQLIAAANVCDEQVYSPVAGANESRYTINGQWDTATSPGDLIDSMMSAAGGRISYIGGEWYLWPAYWQGPSFTFGEGDLLNDISWTTTQKLRDRYNRVSGTFIAPRFPYAVAGNLYDSNGFYNGTRANLFGLEWQAESYPDYAQDALHGYAVDPWLTADQGYERVMNLSFKCVNSIAQAQRLAKIALLRNRLGGGKTTITLSMAAYQAIPCDVIQLNFAPLNWVNKLFEITAVHPPRVALGDDGVPQQLVIDLDIQETDPAIYEWNPNTEELTINDTPPLSPGTTYSSTYAVAAPSNLSIFADGAAAAIQTPDGVVRPRLGVSWTAAADAYVTQYQVQAQLVGSSMWLDARTVIAGNTATYINDVVPGQAYNVRIRSVRRNGAASAWLTLGGPHTVASAYSQINSLGLAPTTPPAGP